jgi:hypothetical protein
MKSRGVAVIAAFVLIALALFVRGRIVDDGGTGSKPGNKDGDGAPVVACTPELAAVCDALAAEGSIAADPPMLDLPEAAEPPADVDGWITWNPAPAIANYIASPQLSSVVWDQDGAEALGSATQVALVDQATNQALPAACRSTPTWSCLGGAEAGLAVGVGDPATSEGIARLAPFARAFATDDDHETLDVAAVDDLVRSTQVAQSDAATMAEQLTTSPGTVSIVAGPDALLTSLTTTARGEQRGLRVLRPTPSARLTVVLAARSGRADELDGLGCDQLDGSVTAALRAAGVKACTGTADAALAGFLYQVQKKVG